MDQQQEAIWENFMKYKGAYREVERLLKGRNAVAVFTARHIALGPYDGIDPKPTVELLKQRLETRGASLPIAGDGPPQLAYITWKRTNPITRPTEIAMISFIKEGDAGKLPFYLYCTDIDTDNLPAEDGYDISMEEIFGKGRNTERRR
jgi:hypothetical protein